MYIYQYAGQGNGALEQNIFVALHERFHFFQDYHPPFSYFEFNAYPDLHAIENLALSQLELKVLEAYWIKHQDESLTNFREQHLEKKSIEHELAKEVWEGLANYFSFSAIPDNILEKESFLQSWLETQCSSASKQLLNCQLQWRYYYTGAIVAFALDKLAIPNWKERFIQQHIPPRMQLQQFFNMDTVEIKQRVERAKKQFNFTEMEVKLHEKMDIYLNRMRMHLSKYAALEGITLEIEDNFASGGSFEEEYFLDGLQRLLVNRTMRGASDNKHFLIMMDKMPYLLEMGAFMQMKLDGQTKIILDGQTYKLEDLVNITEPLYFSNLLLRNTVFNLQIIDAQGVFSSHDGKISIKPQKNINIKYEKKIRSQFLNDN